MNEQHEAAIKEAAVNNETAAVNKKTIANESTARDRAMALGMFLLAFLASDTFGLFTNHYYYGYGVTVTAVLFGISILIYAKKENQKLPAEGYFWLAIMILAALSYTFVYHQSLSWFHPIFLRLTVLYTILVLLGALIKGKTSGLLIFDGLNMLIVIPFHNLDKQWRIACGEIKQMKMISVVVKGVLGLLVALPLLFVVAALLASADAQFGRLLNSLIEQLGGDVFRILRVFISSLLVGCFLFGLIYGAAHKRGTGTFKAEPIQTVAAACAVIPAASIYTVLFAVCLIYLLFIGLQGGYYLNALQGILPEGFTYSEYARRGFFELVTVSMINLGILGMAALFCRGRGIILKGFHVILSIQTLFLIGTALTKMFLYIDVYGLTPLRVIPSVFMFFLAFLFLLIIIKQFRPLPLMRLSLCVFAVGYVVLSLADMDGRIAAYNLARYEEGTLSEISEELMIDGSLASVPALYQVWQRTERSDLKAQIEGIIWHISEDADEVTKNSEHWRYNSIPKRKAMKYMEQMTE